MKKVFQTKLKSITKVLTLVIIASLATFTGCKSYDEDITTLTNDVTSIKTQLASLDTYTKAQIDAKITTLNGEITTLKTSLATLTANGATDAELAALKTDIESRFVTKAALDAYKTQVTTDIAAAVAGLATKVSVDAVSTEVVKVQTALSALGVAVDAKILALKSELNTKDAELAAAIGLVEARVATLEGLVAANTTGVAANKALIVDLQAQLTALKADTYTKAEIDAKLLAIDADLKKLGTDLRLEFEVLATRQLSGLLFVPAWVNDGFNAVEVGYILDKATTPDEALFSQQDVIFRFNPTTANLDGTTWKFINNSAIFNAPGITGAGDADTLFVAPELKRNADGSGNFLLKVDKWVDPVGGKTNYFALQANKVVDGKTSSVVSDYVKVAMKAYEAYIAESATTLIPRGTTLPAFTDAATENIVINGAVVDLDDLVFAASNDGTTKRLFTDALANFGVLGTDYKFVYTNVSYVPGATASPIDNTDQSAFIKINSENKIELLQGTAAIDRTPVVKVELKTIGGKLLATAFIKFKITRTAVVGTYTYPTTLSVTKDYNKLFVGQATIANNITPLALTWQQMNEIYAAMGLTHNEFRTAYNVTPTVKVNGVAASITDYPLVVSRQAQNVDSYAMKYEITPLAKFGTTNLEYTFDPGNNGTKLVVKFAYTINKPVLDKTILAGYRLNGSATDIKTQGMNSGSNYLMQLYLGEAFSFGTSAYRNVFGTATAGLVDGATHNFAFKTTVPAQTGAQLTPAAATTINAALGTSAAPTTGQLMDLTDKLKTAERVYAMQFVTTYPNAETDVFDFNVHFVNPFSIELDPAANFRFIEYANGTADTHDIKANYIVKFKGKKIVTKGVAEITNTATTVVATDFVDITNAAYGLFYELTPGTEYFTVSKAGGNAFNKQSVITWDNVGTDLGSEQTIGALKVKFISSFAEITKDADNLTAKPE